jgi:hypothetical protein
MKKLNQSGFSIIEAVLLLVILAIIGGTGYFVWHTKQNTDKSLTNTAKSAPAISKSKDTNASNGKVDISLPIVTTTYSKVPASLRKAIFDYTKQHVAACVKGNTIVDYNGQSTDQSIVYWSAGWAETGVGCDGGAATVFAQNTDNWQEIAATQDRFSCEQLELYMTPPKFLAAIMPDKSIRCIDNSGNERQLQQT